MKKEFQVSSGKDSVLAIHWEAAVGWLLPNIIIRARSETKLVVEMSAFFKTLQARFWAISVLSQRICRFHSPTDTRVSEELYQRSKNLCNDFSSFSLQKADL